MNLIALLETAEDCDRVLNRGLLDPDWLKAAFEGCILFHIIPILCGRGSSDCSQFTASQLRLEEIGSINRSLTCTSPHDSVKLIDKEDNLTVCRGDLLEKCLQTVLKLPPILCSRNHSSDIHGYNSLVLHRIRNVATHDSPGKALYDRRLTSPWFTNQNRIIFCPAGKDLHYSADLPISSDYRVNLSFPRKNTKISPILLECLVFPLGILIGDLLTPADLFQRILQIFLGSPCSNQKIFPRSTYLHHPEDYVFNTEKVVPHLRSDLISKIQNSSETSRQLRLLTYPLSPRFPVKRHDQPCF